MASPDRINEPSTDAEMKLNENQAETDSPSDENNDPNDNKEPNESDDTEEGLAQQRINRYVSDEVATTPISPVGESNGDMSKETPEERVQGTLNAFDEVFKDADGKSEEQEEEPESEDEGQKK